MTSWRATTPADVQEMFDGMFGIALDFALQMLTKYGEFYPFGLEESAGRSAMTGGDPAQGEYPDSQSVLDLLRDGARSRRDEIDAFARVSDVRLSSGSDGVRIDLEHRDGHALSIVTPYVVAGPGHEVEVGDMSVSVGVREVWT